MATRDSGGVYGPRFNQFPSDKHEIRSTRTIGRSFGGDISRYDPTKQRTTADKTSDHDAVASDHSRALAETNIETITETIALSPIDKMTTMHLDAL